MVLSIAIICFLAYNLAFQLPDNIITVSETQNIDYLVYQKSNPYIEAPFLGMGENYLHSYTDYIKINSNYNCILSEQTNTEYTYRTELVLVARYKKNPGANSNPEILEKPYNLANEVQTVNSDHIDISRSYDLHLDRYKDELSAFAATVDLPVASEIRIDFIVDLNSGKGISSSFTRSVTIPVNTEFYNIDIIGDKTREKEYNLPIKKISFLWIIILILISAAFFIISLILIKKMRNENKSPYRLEIESYLHTYDDLIVNTATPLSRQSHETIYIENFKELLTLSKRINLPIMYFEEEYSAQFYILNNDVVYLFQIDNGE